jgi:hypothetical protein
MRELTESDWTTEAGETTVDDLSLGFGASSFATIPVLGIDLGASLRLIAPTSKVSQARTMIIGLRPGLSLSRKFDVLAGINLNYGFSATKTFHESTTSMNEEPNIAGCVGAAGGCDSYMNTGVRNASWGLSNSFGLGIQFVEWLGVSGSVALLHSFLYEQKDASGEYDMSEGVGGDGGSDVRYATMYNLEIAATPMPALTIAIGADTYNAQLAPDSTYEKPFFNRYTAIYLDLRLDFAGLVSQLTSSEE